MLSSIILIAIVTAGGLAATYLYDDDSLFAIRLCAGACIGLTVLGIAQFVFACIFGLTWLSIGLSTIVAASPLLALRSERVFRTLSRDLNVARRGIKDAIYHPTAAGTGTLAFFVFFTVLMWMVFDRAMFDRAGAIYTGESNNFGDLPFHLSVVTSFAKGQNFPPEDPTYEGVRFTYPFIVDLVAAIFVRMGASLSGAFFVENVVLAVSTVGLVWEFGRRLTRDRLAAMITVLLVIFSGGLGFLKLAKDLDKSGNGIFDLLTHLPASEYTIIPNTALRWGNMISALLLPQRSLLMGLPLALIVFTLWWKNWRNTPEDRQDVAGESTEDLGKQPSLKSAKKAEAKGRSKKSLKQGSNPEPDSVGVRGESSTRVGFIHFPIPGLRSFTFSSSMLAAGVIAGLIPLVHAHTFVSIMLVGGILALMSGPRNWPSWGLFFAAAAVVGVPQMLWAVIGTAVHSRDFFGWSFGWDHGKESVLLFWFENTGLFIPLLVLALAWRRGDAPIPKRLLMFFLPFTVCFIIPNLFKLAPWIWDNVKVLIFWWIAAAPVVALLLAKFMRRGPAWLAASVFVLIILILAGGLDVYRIASSQSENQEFDANGVKFAAMIEQNTPPRALILHATTHNHPLFLTGRRSVMGYPGHIYSHGLDYQQRETDIRVMYAGGSDSLPLLAKYGVDYVVVSGIENAEMRVNNMFFEQRMTKVGEVGDYRLYKVTR